MRKMRHSLNTPWLRAFILDWLVILVAYNAAFALLPIWLALFVSVMVIGTRIHALAVLAHDGAHFNAPSEWFARLAFSLIARRFRQGLGFSFSLETSTDLS